MGTLKTICVVFCGLALAEAARNILLLSHQSAIVMPLRRGILNVVILIALAVFWASAL